MISYVQLEFNVIVFLYTAIKNELNVFFLNISYLYIFIEKCLQ
jgi:hypothetical protein